MQSVVEEFIRYCRIERRLAEPTCSAYERDVTACARFLHSAGFSDWRLVKPPDLRRFLAAEAETRPAGEVWKPSKRERDRLMLALLPFGGLRKSELLGLDWDDVDLERRLVRIRRAKGGRQRVVPLHPALVPFVVDYAAARAADREPAMFVGVQGKRLSQTIIVPDVPAVRARSGGE